MCLDNFRLLERPFALVDDGCYVTLLIPCIESQALLPEGLRGEEVFSNTV